MADIKKNAKEIPFEVQLNWLTKQEGILFAGDVQNTLHVATPPAFGGDGGEWSPEHLFLGAISSCFMTTYLFFAKRMALEVSRLECNATGIVEMVGGKYQFTRIVVTPKIYVALEAWKEKAQQALQKTEEYCLISNSVKTPVVYEGEVIEDLHPRPQLQQS